MDEDGNFTYKKPEPEPQEGQPQEGGEEQVEGDPYAGTNIDASQMGQMQEEMMQMAQMAAQQQGVLPPEGEQMQ